MILSEASYPNVNEFAELVEKGRQKLQADAQNRPEYYAKEHAQKLEYDVLDAMTDVAKGTAFEGSMILISGHKFPDIVSKLNEEKLYGIEVKSTVQNHWESFGNSVLESSRVDYVERIFIMFGKLAKPIEFKARPYEECLSEVLVTHYPRYHINMRLKPGETIFDKIGMKYDEVRMLPDPVRPFADYYRKQLKPGEALWWLGNSDIEEEHSVKISLLSSLGSDLRQKYAKQGLVLFPEIVRSKKVKKYDNFILWMVAKHGVVSTSTRDLFTAGGRVDLLLHGTMYKQLPHIFKHINDWKNDILYYLNNVPSDILCECWKIPESELLDCHNRLNIWVRLVYSQDPDEGSYKVKDILDNIFRD